MIYILKLSLNPNEYEQIPKSESKPPQNQPINSNSRGAFPVTLGHGVLSVPPEEYAPKLDGVTNKLKLHFVVLIICSNVVLYFRTVVHILSKKTNMKLLQYIVLGTKTFFVKYRFQLQNGRAAIKTCVLTLTLSTTLATSWNPWLSLPFTSMHLYSLPVSPKPRFGLFYFVKEFFSILLQYSHQYFERLEI